MGKFVFETAIIAIYISCDCDGLILLNTSSKELSACMDLYFGLFPIIILNNEYYYAYAAILDFEGTVI